MALKIFSFCLYGNQEKYCKGLLKNLECIQNIFSDFLVWVYIGDNVNEKTISDISKFENTKIIFTNEKGHINKFFRFFPIDNTNVEICIVRDADSRIYDRDVSCIKDFFNSEKLFHIIRDHPNHHTWKIMAGMWGIKKGLVDNIKILYEKWKEQKSIIDFWDDQIFLSDILHPLVKDNVLVHEAFLTSFESQSSKTSFKVPILNGHFVGQVYEFTDSGIEYAKFGY